MKQPLPHHISSVRFGSAVALAIVTSLAISPLTFAKGPPGGGNPPAPGVTINPVPDLVDPPIGYTETELVWKGDIDGNGIADRWESSFGGVGFYGINNQGLVTSIVYGPHPTDPTSLGRRIGGINLDPITGAVSDQVFDMNEVFAAALAGLNSARTDGPWRIASGLSVTDSGLVAAVLIPDISPRRVNGAVPFLLAVGDLARRMDPSGLMVIPGLSDGDTDLVQLTENGSALVLEEQADGRFHRVFPLLRNAQGESVGYSLDVEMPIPRVNPSVGSSLKDSEENGFYPELIYTRMLENSVSQIVRYIYTWSGELDENGVRINDFAEESVLHEISNPLSPLESRGFGTGGTAYAETLMASGKGKTLKTWWTPYHLISPTERTPLTASGVSASVAFSYWSVSDARTPGEEEVTIRLDATEKYLIYKPNFGARFSIPVPPLSGWFLEVSPPVDPSAVTTGAADYAAGYVGYGLGGSFKRTFVLTPDGATVPGQ